MNVSDPSDLHFHERHRHQWRGSSWRVLFYDLTVPGARVWGCSGCPVLPRHLCCIVHVHHWCHWNLGCELKLERVCLVLSKSVINLRREDLCLHELVVCLEKKFLVTALSRLKVTVEKNDSRVFLCICVYALRIVSMDKILHCFIMIIFYFLKYSFIYI